MNLLSVKNLSKMGREKPLFSDVTFGLNEGEKAALIGKNGTGKSTLLNCIAGVLQSDGGTAVFNSQAGVSFLPQNPVFDPEHTIRDHIFARQGQSAKLAVIREYEEVCEKIASNPNPNPGLEKQFEKVSEQMNEKNLWNYEAEIKSILTVLGISMSAKGENSGMDRKMGELSGGMVKKVALAQVLVEDSKLILLDEPTNHLDMTTISWLEDYLRTTSRAVLMVTHDRYFLDSVCSSIYELEHGKFNHYKGNFSDYLEAKATELEIAQNTERRIESVLRTERDWLMRGPCARGTKARARVDHIHSLINRDKLQQDASFSFEVAGRRLGGKVLVLDKISKNYPKASAVSKNAEPGPVLKDFSYTFKKGERIGVFGNNGSGKSTFLNIITGRLAPDSGTVEAGINTAFGYYEQNPFFADTSLSVLEYLKEVAEHVTRNDGKTLTAAQMLEQFGFEGKILYSPVSSLSGGERKRLYLVRLLMSNPNFLVLDEPTNDFDIFTMSVLESFLQTFAGCILVVSHDRYFMDKVADTMFILEDDGSVSGYVGKCSHYMDYRKEVLAAKAVEERASAEKAAKAVQTEKSAADSGQPAKKKRRTFKEQKEFETLENDIFELEDRKSELEALLSGGESDHEKLGDYSREYSAVSQALDEKYPRWEELAELDPM
ncbi:MAG: ATP-binding cassette domain-containing protein [Treponemataceae bacterium]|nr:ATP-binding cassette domain-containing protein [Treponemataceae bacterium]